MKSIFSQGIILDGNLRDKYVEFQEKLLEIKGNNRCIRMRRIIKKHTFDLSSLSELDESLNRKILDGVLSKKSICIVKDSDKSDIAITMRTHLKEIYRNIRQSENETGSQYGYLGFPFLSGHLNSKYFVRGPLALFSVSLEYKRSQRPAGWYITFSKNAVKLNKILFVALEKILGIEFNNIDKTFEELFGILNHDESELGFLKIFKKILETNNVSIKNDSEDFSQMKFQEISLDDLEIYPLSIVNHKILGSFPQLNSAIYENYDFLLKKIAEGESDELLDTLMGKYKDKDIDLGDSEQHYEELDKIDDSEINNILQSDSSQDQIILASQKNRMLIINGPPGTGKSQVIVNLISNSLMRGEKVLVVCDKKPALEVVHHRLSEINSITGRSLSDHVAFLDKEKSDRGNFVEALLKFLKSSNKTNSIYEDDLSIKSRQITNLIGKHAKLANALTYDCNGIKVNELYARAEPEYDPVLSFSEIKPELNLRHLDDFLNEISKNQKEYALFENPDFSWSVRTDFSNLRINDKKIIDESLQLISENISECIVLQNEQNQNELDSLTKDYLKYKNELSNTENKLNNSENIVSELFSKNNLTFNSEEIELSKKNIEGGLVLWNTFGSFKKIQSVRENSFMEDDVKKQKELLGIIEEAKTNTGLKSKFSPTARQKKKTAEEFLQKHNVDETSAITLIKNGLDLWNTVEWNLKPHILETPFILTSITEQNNALDLLNTFSSLQSAKIEHEKLLNKIDNDISLLLKVNGINIDLNTEEFSNKISRGANVISGLTTLSKYLSVPGIEILHQKKNEDPEILLKIIQNLSNDLHHFDSLIDFDNEKLKMSELVQNTLKSCIENIPHSENWGEVVRKEIFHYFIVKMEDANDILKGNPFAHYDLESEKIIKLLDEKRNLVSANITLKIEKHALRNSSRKLSLEKDLKRKRMPKSIRQIIDEYGQIIFNAVPCWLASPDMISNIFPMEKNLFDLIIVDEASQLAAERAIPFLYRGKQIVVAGDEHQLTPHDLFNKKDENLEKIDDDEIVSFLNLVNDRSLGPRMNLSWHYRSKWQELIDFSNYAFYDNNLQVAPNVRLNPPEPPIKWISVSDGVWEDQSNEQEADKIIDKIHELLLEYKSKNDLPSIGVITFNSPQKELILKKIETRKLEDPKFKELYDEIEFPEPEFKNKEILITNIENVQGDQRDIILFSVAFSYKSGTTDIHKNFGLISRGGGENRLNVAITRATERIYVVCSFDPEHLVLNPSSQKGSRLLKQFLRYAKAVSENNTRVKQSALDDASEKGMSALEQISGDVDSPFEKMVTERLERKGYKISNNVKTSGFRIDLAVFHPNDPTKFILAIECDGAQFHQTNSVRERDVSRQKLLESQGWVISRIWSRDYWRNPGKEIDKIVARIDELLKKDSKNTFIKDS